MMDLKCPIAILGTDLQFLDEIITINIKYCYHSIIVEH